MISSASRARTRPLALGRAGAPLAVTLALALPGCASDNDLVLADAALDAEAASAAQDLLVARAHDLSTAAAAVCAAAPAPHTGGWSSGDSANLASMKLSWKEAQRAYRSVEGAVGLLFPDLAAALDGRYEEALARGSDPDLFGGGGF